MEEEIKTQKKERKSFDTALLALCGKTLLIDTDIAMSYFGRFMSAIETGVPAFTKNNHYELIGPDKSRVIETANLWSMKDERIEAIPKGTIIKLYLNDYMSVNGDMCSMGVQELANNLLSYRDNPNVVGALLEVNSGGGEAMAGQILYNAIAEFNKPVISHVYTAGSAAYMAILKSKEIIAAGDLSRIGSIGAYVTLDKKFIAGYKDRFEDIYSDLSTDKNSAIREYIQTGDTQGIKTNLNESVDAFQNMVLSNMDIKKKEETLSGGMFIASEAKRRGLIHMIATESVALKRLNNYIK